MNKREIPKGLRDLLPDEVAVKRSMEQKYKGNAQHEGYFQKLPSGHIEQSGYYNNYKSQYTK
jgi:histidyl-tRNA synthetase